MVKIDIMSEKLLLFLLLQIIFRYTQSQTVIRSNLDQNSWPSFIDEENADLVDWSRHPCRRPCDDNHKPMECYYFFKVDNYYTMSRACYDCPRNLTDCFRPHCVPVDGVKRSLVVVNNQMPGPLVEVCQGDRVIVDVLNEMDAESTTIHWHGQHMKANPYMDGTPSVSQCPILSKHTFRYDFIAETPGTHFWHSHVGVQRGDGVFGPLIVQRPAKANQLRNLYDYDEHRILLNDWIHSDGRNMFLAHYHSTGDNKPTNLLINGLGRFWAGAPGIPDNMPLATFVVKQGSRHRFRFINAEFLNCPVEVSIDYHKMFIVSSDGRDVDPMPVESLVTYAGERFDFIVMMNQTIGNYWIRIRGLVDCGPEFTKAYQVAILRYEGAPEEDPKEAIAYEIPLKKDVITELNSLNKGIEEETFRSVATLTALDKNSEDNTRDPDHQFFISYDYYKIDNVKYHRKDLYGYHQAMQKRFTPQLNHISMKMPAFPLMAQTDLIDPRLFCNDSSVSNCKTEHCVCPHVLQVRLNSVVELILIDEGLPFDANHPFHLHGHSFRVIGMQRLAKNITLDEVKRADREGRIIRRLDKAPIKDTVTVPDGGFTVVRFYANNPGYWLFHCHLDFHAEVGMALVFKVGEHEDFKPVPRGFPRCGPYPSNSNSSATPRNDTSGYEDPKENEVDAQVDEKVRNSIANWLPLILSELRAANNAQAATAGSTLVVILACFCSAFLNALYTSVV